MKKHMYRAVPVQQIDAEALIGRAADGPLTIGCDAAKFDWRAAVVDSKRVVLAVISFSMPNDLEQILKVFSKLRDLGREVCVVAEVTGTYSEPFADAVRAAGFPMHAVNASHVKRYGEIYDGVPSSHDSKSACVIATLHIVRPAPAWRVLSDSQRVMRAYACEVDLLQREIMKWRNQLEAQLALFWPELPRQLPLNRTCLRKLLIEYGCADAVRQDPKGAAQLLKRVGKGGLKADKLERIIEDAKSSQGRVPLPEEVALIQFFARRLDAAEERIKLVEKRFLKQSVEIGIAPTLSKRIGKVTAAMLYALGADFAHFPNARALLKYLGLNLTERSSGTHKGKLKISKRGSGKARRWLYLAALRLKKSDPVACAWVELKASRSGCKMKAIIALMRKLVTALPHLARGHAYDPAKLFDIGRLKRLGKLPQSYKIAAA